MEIDVGELGVAERYKLLVGAIVPRPIGFVSTVSVEGKDNLAPFSFFNGVGSNPMMVVFCPSNTPDGGEKDTLRNCKPREEGGVGEFVVNIVSEGMLAQMAACAEELAWGESEFALSGLTPGRSQRVKPARVVESAVCFECVTDRVIRTNPGAPGGGNVVLGRVVHVYVRDGVIDERMRIDPDELKAIGRMGGEVYARTGDRVAWARGREALKAGE